MVAVLSGFLEGWYVGISSATPLMFPQCHSSGQQSVTSDLSGTAVSMSVKSEWISEGLTGKDSFIKVLERSIV